MTAESGQAVLHQNIALPLNAQTLLTLLARAALRIFWTNEEDEAGAVTTVTFADQDGETLVTFHEIYPSAEGLKEALQGGAAALPEQFDQLGEVVGQHRSVRPVADRLAESLGREAGPYAAFSLERAA